MVLTIILLILAIPTVAALLWLGGVFVREYIRETRSGDGSGPEGEEAEESPGPSRRAADLGMLPPERQDTRTAFPLPEEVTDALRAARGGVWRPAAALLGTIGADWERRSHVSYLLGEIAAVDDGWLRDWEAELPGCADAAVVRAQATVVLAWKLRGSRRATHTSAEEFEDFHLVLKRSRLDIARAAGLNPTDPTPHVIEIWTALGLGYGHEEMERLWSEITARAPHHYEAHFSALQYWCAKWRGSHEKAMEFAVRAAASAPLGSLLTAMPLLAHYERAVHEGDTSVEPDRTPEMIARVDKALMDVAAADPNHLRLAEVRHLLAYYLTWQDRHEAAVEQFRLVDGHVGALPWRYEGDNAAVEFCRVRDMAVEAAAERV
ncbi:hypothetical protein [Streptomyces sp. ST2-7A]|uniref:hypothetical protein n=1 Tax=Streptomyces sp. ST2-7A TaxID=2907214 RepID=UPI001F1DE786|nr:hypothetical protein [Streptomyces sp. ST2-7A]MCE7082686.1 hypothetical protein [Streptomyces sp. ST2-7A]